MVFGKFTVYYEDPFWIGIAEVCDEEKQRISKIVFGDEPSGVEIYEFIKNNYSQLIFNEIDNDEKILIREINPKRMIKLVKKEQKEHGIGTKSQLAMKKIQENKKIEIKKESREEKERVEKIKFLIKQEKRKQKKKGH